MTAGLGLRFAIVFLLAAALFTPATMQSESSQKDRLVAHEWGTFTSISNAYGKALVWRAFVGPSDLPNFVYRLDHNQCPKCALALVRMETPVIYFYADREMKVSVNVDFPKGRITEWYPHARLTNPSINWSGFDVMPGARENFPVTQGESHYYPARETDAAPIRSSYTAKPEHEKFLFYRGLGYFEPPLSVRFANDQAVVRNPGRDEIAQVILFENREGKAGWRIHDSLKGEATLARPALDQPVESLQREMEKMLVAQGLYQKEAAAMIKTWRDLWFEEGLRVFYIVPRKTTDAILPITINPAPTELARVFVGRAEIITPEVERNILSAAKQFNEGSNEARAAAINTVRRYGRLAEPVLREAADRLNNNAAASHIWTLIAAATSKPVAKSD